MPTGYTTTGALADSLPVVISAARIVREFVGVMPNLVEKQTLGEGIGLSWNEISLAQLTATAVTESTRLDNPQQIADTLFTITPTVFGIHTVVTDRVATRISKTAFAKIGTLAMNGIQRKKDEDGLTLLDGATTSLAGAGVTLTSGHIAAAVARVKSNTTEPGMGPVRCVLHGFQIKDTFDEITGGIGTYPVPEGMSAQVWANMFHGKVSSAEVFEDGNITIDGSDDAKGGVFIQSGIVLVQGRNLRTYPRFEPDIGGGATSIWIYDEYAFGERLAGGSTSSFVIELYSDALQPTS